MLEMHDDSWTMLFADFISIESNIEAQAECCVTVEEESIIMNTALFYAGSAIVEMDDEVSGGHYAAHLFFQCGNFN